MSSDNRQTENDPRRGLSPWTIAAALGAGAAVWFIVEIIERVMS